MAENKQDKRPNVPPLRFPEFTEPWERYKLSEFATKITKKNRDNSISNVLSNSATLGIVQQSQYFEREIVTDENLVGYYVINEDDFVYNPRKSVTAPYGPVNRYYCKESGIISPLYLCFKVNGINKSFLLWFFKSPKWYRYIHLNGDSGVRHDRVSIKDDLFLDMPINVPSRAEQEKVSNLFELIDRRIAAQSKLIQQLESLIKGICRDFHNNTNGWLQVSFSELGADYGGLSNKTAADFGKGKPFITYLNVYTNRVVDENQLQFVKVTENESQNKVKWGDVLFTLSSETPDEVAVGSVYIGNNNELYLNSFCFGIHIDNEQIVFQPYLAYLISSPQFRKWVFPLAQGSTRFNLQKSDFMKKKFLLPPLEEQKKLYQCLNFISRRIAIETSILNDFQELKLSLLKQMFI